MAPAAVFFAEGNYYVLDRGSRDRLEIFDDRWNIKKVVPLSGISPIDEISAAEIDMEEGKIRVFLALQKALENSPTKEAMEINSYDGGQERSSILSLSLSTEVRNG